MHRPMHKSPYPHNCQLTTETKSAFGEGCVDVLLQGLESSPFRLAGGFFHDDGQSAEFRADAFCFEQSQASRQDGGLNHRVFGPIEADEVSDSTGCYDLAFDHSALGRVVKPRHAKGVPATSVLQDDALHAGGGDHGRQCFEAVDRRQCQYLYIVCDVKNALPRSKQTAERARGAIRAEHQLSHLFIHDRADRRNVRCTVQIERGDEAFKDHTCINYSECHGAGWKFSNGAD